MEETKQKKPKRSPTPRQRKVAKALVENLLKDQPSSIGQVLENVGYGTIVQDPKRITESEGVQTALAEIGLKDALVKQGITPERIASKIDVLLNAKKFIQKFSHETGETELIGEQDDYQAIDKGLAHATKIYGILDPGESKPNTGNTYNFIFSDEVRKKVSAIDAEIKQALIKPNAQKD